MTSTDVAAQPEMLLDQTTKGLRVPAGEQLHVSEIADRRWNALRGDLEFPALVAHRDALESNIGLMSAYCRDSGVLLAPHSKTSMSPELCRMQLAAGAWGLTAATTNHVRTLLAFGVRRILMANVLVDPAAIRAIATALEANPELEFYCYVDSLESMHVLEESLAEHASIRPMHVLIEVGYNGGRTGTRTRQEGLLLAEKVHESSSLALAGVAGFEGLIPDRGDGARLAHVRNFLTDMKETAEQIAGAGFFDTIDAPIVTAGGSAYFDLVVDVLSPTRFSTPIQTVLRSGCYVTHDHGTYEETSALAQRGPSSARSLKPALELLVTVWSRPEPGLVIAGFGRRDVPTDDRMPTVLRVHGEGRQNVETSQFAVVAVNDQHAFITVPDVSDIAVGDILGLGISHPCGAFDRWRFISVVNETYDVVSGLTVYL